MKPTSEVIDELTLAEASAWLTRLQDVGRTPATEAAFKAWLAGEPAHARAFTLVNDVWELIPGAALAAQTPQIAHVCHPRARTRRTPWLIASTCAALVLVAVGAVHMFHPGAQVYQTAVGGQRTVVLRDNTRVTLNTDSRIVVEYRKNERRVQLERGEALFHVTENPRRPFVVQTGDAQIVDLGTVFDVRHYSRHVAVTLLEGKVWVGARNAPSGRPMLSTVLVPGERLTLQANGTDVLDRPSIQETMAWQHGQVYFDDVTLTDAVAELGRYGGPDIRIASPVIGSLRVSGVFSVRDPAEFAQAVAGLHDLQVTREGQVIVLKR